MFLKERNFDEELSYLLQLSIRAKISIEDNERIDARIKGINGERRFDELVRSYLKHGIVLNNLQYIVNKQVIQIDALIIMNNEIFIFEIKNLHYELHFKDNKFYYMSGLPAEKLNEHRLRTPKLMKQLLLQNHINLPFNYYTTFVNPDYKIYGYLPSDAIIEYQIIPKILEDNSRNPICKIDEHVAQKLLSLHNTDEKFNFRKRINIEDLKMGVVCHCHIALLTKISNRKFACPACKKEVDCNTYIQKAIQDIRLMFPTERLTVTLLKEWTTYGVSREKLRNYLNQHHKMTKCGPLTYYR